jgi:hypothetical protein
MIGSTIYRSGGCKRNNPPAAAYLFVHSRAGLLCGAPPLLTLLSERPLLAALQHYEHASGAAAPGGVLHALELAHVLHHTQQPLACLAAAALSESTAVSTADATTATATAAGHCTDKAADRDGDDISRHTHPRAAGSGKGQVGPLLACWRRGGKAAGNSDSDCSSSSDDGGDGDDVCTPKRRGNVVVVGGQELTDAAAPVFTPSLLRAMGRVSVHSAGKARHGAGCGDTVLERAVAQLPPSVLQYAHALMCGGGGGGGGDAVHDGEQPAAAAAARRASKHSARAAGSTAAATAAASLDICMMRDAVAAAIRSAVDALARWRLGVLLCYTAAEFTGGARDRAELSLPALYAAATSPAFATRTRCGTL